MSDILGDFDNWPGTACHYEEVRERVAEAIRAAVLAAREEVAAEHCAVYSRNGTRCALGTDHSGLHVTGTGTWFGTDGVEQCAE